MVPASLSLGDVLKYSLASAPVVHHVVMAVGINFDIFSVLLTSHPLPHRSV